MKSVHVPSSYYLSCATAWYYRHVLSESLQAASYNSIISGWLGCQTTAVQQLLLAIRLSPDFFLGLCLAFACLYLICCDSRCHAAWGGQVVAFRSCQVGTDWNTLCVGSVQSSFETLHHVMVLALCSCVLIWLDRDVCRCVMQHAMACSLHAANSVCSIVICWMVVANNGADICCTGELVAALLLPWKACL